MDIFPTIGRIIGRKCGKSIEYNNMLCKVTKGGELGLFINVRYAEFQADTGEPIYGVKRKRRVCLNPNPAANSGGVRKADAK
jgi:hypothetical protein